MFYVNHNLILHYSTSVRYQVTYFSHNTYFEELLLELRLNPSKVGIIFATYQKMRAKWTSWSGTSINMHVVKSHKT